MKSLLVAMGAILAFAPGAYAANIVYNEAVNGDLSNNSLNPTTINLSGGSNQIIGSTTGNPNLDRDFFTFTIPTGRKLSQVILANYAGLDNVGANQSFFAVQRGSSIAPTTVTSNSPRLLGAVLIGEAPGTRQGDNVLDDLGAAAPIINNNITFNFDGFPSGRLGPGTYTFWIQETVRGINNYNLNYVVTPEPSTIIGIGAIASIATLLKRKKR